jgi:hypothetical protein
VFILFLAFFLTGILFGVRLLFFGAERRRVQVGSTPLRRSEPALIAFAVMFGLLGYLFSRYSAFSTWKTVLVSAGISVLWAVAVTRVAIAMARLEPEVHPDDPRFVFQGRVAVVTREIEPDREGEVRLDDGLDSRPLRARSINPGGIAVGEEVCIERVEDDLAYVERWTLVEERL